MTRRMDDRPVRGHRSTDMVLPHHRAHPQFRRWKCFRSYCDITFKCIAVLPSLSPLTLWSVGWTYFTHPSDVHPSLLSAAMRELAPSWCATHCEWTLSTSPLQPLLIPHKLPYRKTIQTSQHFPLTMCLLPPSSPIVLFFSYPILLFISWFLSILLPVSRETCPFVSWICMNCPRGARGIIIYCLFIYLFIVYLTALSKPVIYVGANCGLFAWNRLTLQPSKSLLTRQVILSSYPLRDYFPTRLKHRPSILFC